MKRHLLKTTIALAAAGLMAFAPGAFAWDHGRGGGYGYHGGGGYYRGGGYGYHGGGGYYRGGGHYDNAGRWIAGAIIAGAVVGLVANATAPRETVYYDQPVVYSRPVVYERAPVVVERRVYETRTVVDDGYTTRYVRDDGY
ncbi:hypothetical protein EC912_103194 [Luteibacter rhizovicinus]|uniref:PXPV repeat-containing protein n=1 Tax=Luteibacter rhizovicinus TaxID=242606 RepID=A0A4V2W472_9GAMM|nr:hypothetical protein EC912_103194 [Luteibacter rhizovicinus]